MGAVAVGTPGRFLVSQLVGFAMIGLHIAFRQFLVAFAALNGHLVHEFILCDIGYTMSGMTISASWKFVLFIVTGNSMIALDIFVVNPFMAGCTGGRDIFWVYGRSLIFFF
jgi:hypothetical protein